MVRPFPPVYMRLPYGAGWHELTSDLPDDRIESVLHKGARHGDYCLAIAPR